MKKENRRYCDETGLKTKRDAFEEYDCKEETEVKDSQVPGKEIEIQS